jgi:formylglycine-generating enzyme required for sulfatase activity
MAHSFRTLALGISLLGCEGAAATMVPVPAGSVMMGCNEPMDVLCQTDERPYHSVSISSFEIDQTEVTQLAYSSCVEAGACTLPTSSYDPEATPQLPVVYVDWDQADAYCRFVHKRLPTEAEWEKAARGSDGRIYPWGNTPPDCELANITGCGDSIEPVGTHPAGASVYGALDMAGNVMEWVADYYAASYYASSPVADPAGPLSGEYHSKRGGSFLGDPQTVRASYRVEGFPVGLPNLGFRCARSL